MVVMQARGASARCFEILDRSPAIPLQGGTIPDGKIEGDISFKDVNFSYPSRPGESIYVPAQSCRLVWVRVTLTRFNTFTYLYTLFKIYFARINFAHIYLPIINIFLQKFLQNLQRYKIFNT